MDESRGRIAKRHFEFGSFRLDPANACLLREGARVPLEPKALRLLQLLIEARGELLEREWLSKQLWGRVIVTPDSLTRLVAMLRRALDDDASTPRYIGTVHTRGYRWLMSTAARDESVPASPPTLPEPVLGLIGRGAELDALMRSFTGTRLLTIVGPAGTGKTQLALEFGRRWQSLRAAPASWVDLSTAIDLVSSRRLLAAAVGAREREGERLDQAIALALGERERLLILDNCERVTAEVAVLTRGLLGACAGLRVLCTSQATLETPEESLLWLRPLPLPDPAWNEADEPLLALQDSPAVRLLLERALATNPDFVLHADNAVSVDAICRRLDGVPLALELAAPRLATLAPSQLLEALSDRFAVLTRQGSSVDQRHRSLRAALEWSVGLLEHGAGGAGSAPQRPLPPAARCHRLRVRRRNSHARGDRG